MTSALRRWQQQALEAYWAQDRPPEDFLVHATPGAGKTRFAGELAQQLLRRRWIDRVIVVTPTDHLRQQWAAAMAALGLDLAADADNGVARLRPDAAGAVVTYAQVAMKPSVHRGRATAKRTLVLLDEIHHCGDAATWGEAVEEAFGAARLRVGLTGTPFRSAPGERIPRVHRTGGGPRRGRAVPGR
jgi:superfamily II DNA or RNA helicase